MGTMVIIRQSASQEQRAQTPQETHVHRVNVSQVPSHANQAQGPQQQQAANNSKASFRANTSNVAFEVASTDKRLKMTSRLVEINHLRRLAGFALTTTNRIETALDKLISMVNKISDVPQELDGIPGMISLVKRMSIQLGSEYMALINLLLVGDQVGTQEIVGRSPTFLFGSAQHMSPTPNDEIYVESREASERLVANLDMIRFRNTRPATREEVEASIEMDEMAVRGNRGPLAAKVVDAMFGGFSNETHLGLSHQSSPDAPSGLIINPNSAEVLQPLDISHDEGWELQDKNDLGSMLNPFANLDDDVLGSDDDQDLSEHDNLHQSHNERLTHAGTKQPVTLHVISHTQASLRSGLRIRHLDSPATRSGLIINKPGLLDNMLGEGPSDEEVEHGDLF
eukprot:GDKJ01003193.1.p1 GENE.GDKJ01003193.1~~GDKJ01003193.1.p1  ORF type:complete len:397 (-),score=13.64 GDKJ01003193.1:906-2096(-)